MPWKTSRTLISRERGKSVSQGKTVEYQKHTNVVVMVLCGWGIWPWVHVEGVGMEWPTSPGLPRGRGSIIAYWRRAGRQKEKNEEGMKEERRLSWARTGIQMSKGGYEYQGEVNREVDQQRPFFCLPSASYFYWNNKKKVRNIIPPSPTRWPSEDSIYLKNYNIWVA